MDIERLAAAAIESFLRENGQPAEDKDEPRNRLGGIGSVAVGVGLAVAARAAYRRARRLDLERVAGAVEQKLKG